MPKTSRKAANPALTLDGRLKAKTGPKPGVSIWGRPSTHQSCSAPAEFFALMKNRPENAGFRLAVKELIDRFSPVLNQGVDN